ncbi:hydroxyacid dehydrogenase [Cupriavidus consociatus]|uniref:hydroxyacid dehydrogenase n=1 Tax=Cupriavidus consociatus TaxID=2821357 RepID=UPI001AE75EC9|nr:MULTISPECIES: hydroxyacid dehydrogenase [unclassified Cupriavidus]MBP0623335.1 hydroxyacid dehydrogenase [Cupriavidus sp. LEh25]MDK2660031.1 hydroxyacid dehydrogenase [Cupriavidus sp. LEh21]
MKRICISEFMDPAAVQALTPGFDVRYEPGWVDQRPALLDALPEADALIVRNRTQVDAALLERSPALRVVGRLGVGLDNIDVGACRERGIQVIPAVGANARSVAEYVVTTAAMLLRGAYLASEQVAAGAWPRARLSEGREALGKTLGLIGYGDIGRQTAALAQAFGMQVVAYDPMLSPDDPVWASTGATCVSLETLLEQSDAVSLHVPLVAATRHLIEVGRLAAMKSGAVLINTARGGVVDESALADALRAGHLAGAALDVFEAEPLSAGSPLAGVPNLLLTPHIGGVTREANARVSMLIARQVRQALEEQA